MTYEPKTIDGEFDLSLFKLAKYCDVVSGYAVEYAYPMYDDEEFDAEWQTIKTSELLLINPEGVITPFQIRHDEDDIHV